MVDDRTALRVTYDKDGRPTTHYPSGPLGSALLYLLQCCGKFLDAVEVDGALSDACPHPREKSIACVACSGGFAFPRISSLLSQERAFQQDVMQFEVRMKAARRSC